MMFRTVLIGVVITSAIAAEKTPRPAPRVPAPDRFHNQPADVVNAPPPGAQWWRAFNDPLLNDLMERAARTNLDVRTAASRLVEAGAFRSVARGDLSPKLDLNVTTNRIRGGYNQGVIKAPSAGSSLISAFDTGVVSGGFQMRWELDMFGGLRKAARAAAADVDAAQADLYAIAIIVRGEVARNYIELRGYEDQIAVVKANIAVEKELLDLIRVRADAGLAADLDVERQAAQLAVAEAVLPDLEAQRLQSAHRIAVLLGDEPGALLERLGDKRAELDVPPAPTAIPTELLKRRPDVRRAEARIAAAFNRVGAARDDLFPKFVITGLSGRQSTDFSGLTVGAGNFFSVGPGITLPIFNAGRIRSNIRVQDARLEQAIRAYEAEVLAAFEETENAFVTRDSAEAKRAKLVAALHASARSVELAQELYLRGLGDFLTVLDAQRQRFQVERELAASETAVLRGTVALYKAMGE